MTGVAQQETPQTTKESLKGTASVTTEKLQGRVEYVEGNRLVVRMTTGSSTYLQTGSSLLMGAM
jgi:hypothetical protein